MSGGGTWAAVGPKGGVLPAFVRFLSLHPFFVIVMVILQQNKPKCEDRKRINEGCFRL